MHKSVKKRQAMGLRLLKYLVVPSLLYLLVFHAYTAPLLQHFPTHFFCDLGDGLQNVWNLWWANEAVTELHQSPWYTTYLHYPHGTSLYYHTLSPYNAFAGVFLQVFLDLNQTFNLLVVSAYLLSGLTAFLLALHLTRSYWPSVLAGFIFTFSSYHFAHGAGHLNLITIQWLPLFVLLLLRLLHRPTVPAGLAAGFALFLNFATDYYYFLYCVLIGLALFARFAWGKRSLAFLTARNHLAGLLSLLLSAALLIGPLAFNLLHRLHLDRPQGSHLPEKWSLDGLALFIPGGHWRFASLTRRYWEGQLDINEGSVYLGLSVLALLVFAWLNRRRIELPWFRFWFFTMIAFAILALGPVLHIFWKPLTWIPMPYSLLEVVLPPVRLSGVPVRMVVMVVLCASIIAAAGFDLLLKSHRRWKRFTIPLLMVVLFIDCWPSGLPYSRPYIDGYVAKLAGLDHPSPVIIKPFLPPTIALYHQTIHEQPMAFGYTSRTTDFLVSQEEELRLLLKERRIGEIRDGYGFRYLIAGKAYDIPADGEIAWFYRNEHAVRLYDLDTLEDEGPTVNTERDRNTPSGE